MVWWVGVCGWLGVVTPSVVALCASIKLGSRFIGRSCLKHPPKRSSIFAVWAVDTGGWKRLNGATIHDLERNVLSGLLVQFFPALFFNPFSLKARILGRPCSPHLRVQASSVSRILGKNAKRVNLATF